jgi:hypothetical protein
MQECTHLPRPFIILGGKRRLAKDERDRRQHYEGRRSNRRLLRRVAYSTPSRLPQPRPASRADVQRPLSDGNAHAVSEWEEPKKFPLPPCVMDPRRSAALPASSRLPNPACGVSRIAGHAGQCPLGSGQHLREDSGGPVATVQQDRWVPRSLAASGPNMMI